MITNIRSESKWTRQLYITPEERQKQIDEKEKKRDFENVGLFGVIAIVILVMAALSLVYAFLKRRGMICKNKKSQTEKNDGDG